MQGLGNISASAYLRLFGTASIVWFHTAPSWPLNFIGGIGLAVFLYLSFLHVGQPRGFCATLKRRGTQLLVPWVCWFLVYAAVTFWTARGVPPALSPTASIWALLAWPSIHLWYLPCVFFATLGVWPVCRIAVPIQARFRATLALVVGLGLLPILAAVPPLPTPAAQVVVAIPAIGLGLAYGYGLSMECRRTRLGWFVAIAALVAASCVPIWFSGDRMVAIAATGGSLMMILCALPLPRYRLLIRLSSLTLGIYLAHPFAMLVLLKFLGSGLPHWAFALATLVLATLMAWAMRQIRFLRVMV
jgi:fucose 4-O-acetylase-like acetyltransferase